MNTNTVNTDILKSGIPVARGANPRVTVAPIGVVGGVTYYDPKTHQVVGVTIPPRKGALDARLRSMSFYTRHTRHDTAVVNISRKLHAKRWKMCASTNCTGRKMRRHASSAMCWRWLCRHAPYPPCGSQTGKSNRQSRWTHDVRWRFARSGASDSD